MLFADLHIHSKYSRACSKDLTLDNLEKWARVKGLNLLGTGDFTHPLWFKHLKESLYEDETGFLKTKTNFPFVLQSELSLMYPQDGKGRRIHLVVTAPSFDVASQLTDYLAPKGKLIADGRPIFSGLTCADFVYEARKISDKIEIIPAHIWTPWFGLLGSKSGFNSFKECFKDQEKHIHALETGLSSDPEMNYMLSSLDKYTLVSNSDSHSFWPWRIGRESNILDIKPTYDNLIKAIRTKKGFKGTIEVDPNYGIYHFDGHRECNVCLNPEESLKLGNNCPKCGKPLTLGVLHRVEELADRKPGYTPRDAPESRHLMPLSELISLAIGKGLQTKAVFTIYNQLISKFGTEFEVLLNSKPEDLNTFDKRVKELIIKNRNQELTVKPGYDGVYGSLSNVI